MPTPATAASAGVDLFWIPLGSGGHVVRWNGRAYEALKALAEHRERYSLYHSALEVTASDGRFVIEVTPVARPSGVDRGVVGEGAVGIRSLGRFRLFRYEVRRWRDGVIADVADPGTRIVRISDDPTTAELILESIASVPRPVWGRDGFRTGDMWNSNSVVSWVLATSGVDVGAIPLPERGRAPGWDAGIRAVRSPCKIATVDGVVAAGHEAGRVAREPHDELGNLLSGLFHR